jgi:hypothetical protein
MILFVISVVLALVALLSHYAGVRIPVVNASRAFDLLAVAWVVLTLGVLFRGA